MARKKQSNVDKWLKRETKHKKTALENASKHFNRKDSLSVNLLEAIYGQESSFGTQRRKRGMAGAAGDFQIEKKTAERMGLNASMENDQRFDIDDSSAAAAKYLKTLDDSFSKETSLARNLKITPVKNSKERMKFTLAAYNAGEGRIAKAQKLTKKAGKDPSKWEDVKEHLKEAGASASKVEEVQDYVDDVLANSKEFAKKSKADKRAKNKRPKKIKDSPKGGHWITKDGRHILIQD